MPIEDGDDYLDYITQVLENLQKAQERVDWVGEKAPYVPDEIVDFVKDTEGSVIKVIKNDNGEVISVYQEVTTRAPVSEAASSVNSNAASVTVTTKNPISTFINEQGKVSYEGMGNFTLKSVGQAVAAVSTGIALGKIIDKAIYNYYPADQLFGIDIKNFDPDTWGNITEGQTGIGAWAFNHIFGIDPATKEVQEYANAEELAYMARYLASKDIISVPGTGEARLDDYTGLDMSNVVLPVHTYNYSDYPLVTPYPSNLRSVEIVNGVGFVDDGGSWTLAWSPEDDYRHAVKVTLKDGTVNFVGPAQTLGSMTVMGKTVYWGNMMYSYRGGSVVQASGSSATNAYIARYGNVEAPSVPGVSDEPGAHVVNLPDGLTQEQALDYIRTNFPEIWTHAVTQEVVTPDGDTQEITFLPIPSVLPSTDNEVVTGAASQLEPAVQPNAALDILQHIADALANVVEGLNPTPSDTGTGSNIPVVFPVSHSLWAIYNPSQSEIDAFGSWLWSDNPIEQIKKIFANPMDAVIGVHKVFVNPPVAGRRNIKAGYLDSGVNSNYIGAQYVEVDCGTVDCTEYFGNVFDYYPHTNLELYLPFVGIVQLDPADVMRSSINVKYGVDVLTGDCLAMVTINRDGYSGILYSYPGNCAVRYPVTGGTYISALASIAANAVLLYGGMAPAVPLKSANVQHSGSFQGNCGATGPKIPYLIIRRPQTLLAPTFPGIEGVPSNHSDLLGNYTGFVKVLDCHLDTICATSAELDMISELLKEGIIV